jgi:hypothetical protein
MGEVNSHINRDVITSNNILATNGCNLNLDIHNFERLRADIYLNKAGISCLVELSETCNKTNRA